MPIAKDRKSDGDFIISLQPSTWHYAVELEMVGKRVRKFNGRDRSRLSSLSSALKRSDKNKAARKRYAKKMAEIRTETKKPRPPKYYGEIHEEDDLSSM